MLSASWGDHSTIMSADVGIVIPALDPDPERIAAYIEALEVELEPDRIHVELDCPSEAAPASLADTVATVYTADERRGKGAAITAGFERLNTDILAFVDADGSTPPASLDAVLGPLIDGDADLSVGSRRHPDATVRTHQSRLRRRSGDLFVHVAGAILPVSLHDYQCGAKAIRADTWQEVKPHLVTPGFGWDIELVSIAHVLGARLTEVPIVWEDKPGSTVSLVRTVPDFGGALLRSWHRAGVISGAGLHVLIDGFLRSPPSLVDVLDGVPEER